MKQIKITINNMDNAAFEFDKEREVARILRDIADKIERGHEPTKPMDYNGNSVGKIEYK